MELKSEGDEESTTGGEFGEERKAGSTFMKTEERKSTTKN
jgi:hypothetical protein